MSAAIRLTALVLAAFLAACEGQRDGALEVAFIASEEQLFETGLPVAEAVRPMRAATEAGLVELDQQGEVVPGLADQWVVTDGGRSFIFRLRDGTWPDGEPLTAETVRNALRSRIRELQGTPLGLDLDPVLEVRAMAGRVIEFRLAGPVPALLQLLAQPELALSRGEEGTGSMFLVPGTEPPQLHFKPPQERGLPEEEDWGDYVTPIAVRAADTQTAIDLFEDGAVEVVMGGRLGGLTLVDAGPLSRGTVRLDPAIGLFGLRVVRPTGPLASTDVREGIAMALDRAALLAPFNIGGWTPSSRVVSPGLPGDPGFISERWPDEDIEALRDRAASRVSQWRAESGEVEAGEELELTLEMPAGRGWDLLFDELADQLAGIGLTLRRVPDGAEPDLVLVDTVARYAGPRWFLNQFNCSLHEGLCNEDTDYLVEQAVDEPDLPARATLLAEAEAELTLDNIFIPFGPPVRWSLVRSTVDNFVANRWAFHPLPPLAQIPR